MASNKKATLPAKKNSAKASSAPKKGAKKPVSKAPVKKALPSKAPAKSKIPLKAAAKKALRWLGISTTPIYFEKYHHKRPMDNGQFLIHGHTHSKHKINGKAIHVGVDAWNFKPVNIQEISNMIAKVKADGPVYVKYQNNED